MASSYQDQSPRPASTSNVDPANPLDSVVANLVETIHRKGRGFTLGVLKDGDATKVEVVESLKPHDEWLPPVDYRSHELIDTDSFITYVNRYGDAAKSLVFVAADGCTFVIDEGVERGDRETVTMKLKLSDDWTDWAAFIGKPQKHRDLYNFLAKHEQNLPNPEILARFAKMSTRSEVDHNSDLQQFGAGEVGFKVKTTAGEEMAKFPTRFGIELPVLDQDVGDTLVPPAKVELRLQIEMPLGPGQAPQFTLIAPEWKQTLTRRVKTEIERIRSALPKFTIVHGHYKTAEKLIGDKAK